LTDLRLPVLASSQWPGSTFSPDITDHTRSTMQRQCPRKFIHAMRTGST